jgi:hypothetical protein
MRFLSFNGFGLEIVKSSSLQLYERNRIISELDHRLQRLQKKYPGGEI